ncbi:MAG: hypothetical protein JO081_20650 [Alphaproteobacteria bacterium]|nr:hypothetical protein [Alphaproteobacteria bacterium]
MTEDTMGARVKRWAGGARRVCCAAVVGIAAASLWSAAQAVAPMQLTYRVEHSTFGNIGTYINTIEPSVGGTTTVQTRAHFVVKVLGVTIHREDAERTERWQGNRLISFDGVTSKGDGLTRVQGQARGNSFVINSPLGTITAPPTVHPANPWSANFLASSTMMRPDSGRLERVHVIGGAETVLSIDGGSVRARKYEVDGEGHYTVWLNGQGVPVQFVADDGGGKVTFTLASCTGCDIPLAQRVGMK